MKTKATIFWLTLAGLTLRIAYFIIFRNELVASSDIINYIALGRQLSAGRPVGVLDTYWTPFYPFLIGIVTMVTGGLILPTVIISVISGTLAVPITYYLVRQSYGSKEATVAALIAVFFPHLINSTFALGTENVYLLLISGALIAGWVAIKADLARFYLITGCLLGLAYLTRPEAFAYPAFFLLLSVASFVIRKSDRSFAILRNAALMLVAFAVFALPYMFYLRAETGAWTISGKTEINSVMSEFSESSEVNGEFNSKPPPDLSSRSLRVLVSYFVENVIIINKMLPYLVPPLLIAFIGIGLFGTVWTPERLRRESYLIGFCLITFIGYAISAVQIRYFYVLLPIILGWIAAGVLAFASWMKQSFAHWNLKLPSIAKNEVSVVAAILVLFFVYLVPLNFWTRSTDAAWEERAYEERDAGYWLKANGKRSALIFSAGTRVPFYAEGIQMPPRSTETADIMSSIEAYKPDFVVVDDRSLKRNSYLRDLSSILNNSPEFKPVYQDNRNPKYKVTIFGWR